MRWVPEFGIINKNYMKHGSLFSGIGGFDLAAEWMGWDNVFHCEIDDFPRKILNYYWPKAKSYEDITKTDFTVHRGEIDILTGGFPCQPYSAAGKRLGKEDDRHLWPEMLRAIREISPVYVVGENVLGLTNWSGGLVFEEVQADLEAEGYEVQPFVLPAAGVNAPHRRDRVWFVAHTNSNWESALTKHDTKGCGDLGESTANSKHDGHITAKRGRGDGAHSKGSKEGEKVTEQFAGVPKSKELGCVFAANTNSQPKCEETKRGRQISSQERQTIRIEHKAMGGAKDATNTDHKRLERSASERVQEGARGEVRFSNVEPSRNIQGAWQNFPTQSPICGGDDGLPSELDGITFPKWRNESIKGYGNAIVPQVVYNIFRAIIEIECKKS